MASPIVPPTDLAGPPPLAPAPAPLPAAPSMLPMSEDDKTKWKNRIQASRDQMKDIISDGRRNLNRYKGRYFDKAPTRDTMAVPSDFWFTSQKVAQLFYRVPKVRLKGKTEQARAAAPLSTQVLNDYLSHEHTNSKIAMAEGVFDVVCPIGYGLFKIGYEPIKVDIPHPDGLMQPDGVTPVMVKHAVDDHYYVDRLPPGRIVSPVDFTGFDSDKADFIGFGFWEEVPDGAGGSQSDKSFSEDLMADPPSGASNKTSNRKHGHEIWYRASKVDPSVIDPNQIRMFVWMDGDTEPKIHQESPFQRKRDDGSLYGLLTFPVKVLKIRPMSDTFFPPSDCAIASHLADSQSLGRSIELRHRARNMPQNGFDATRVTKDSLTKLEVGESDAYIGFNGPQQDAMWPINKAQIQSDNYRVDAALAEDLKKTWSMSDQQIGVGGDGDTATAASLAQRNSDTRLDYERDWVASFFTDKIAQPLFTLIQLFQDRTQFVGILDAQGQEQFVQWTAEEVQGEFSFEILANSQLRPDAIADQKRITDWVNYSAKSPYVNQSENWRMAAESFGLDPTRLMQQPQPPKPEPPTISISIKPETDLNPMAPSYPGVLVVLQWAGCPPLPPAVTLPTTAAAMMPAGAPQNLLTPGTAPKADLLDKHVADESGHAPGGGAMIPHPVLSGQTPFRGNIQ